MFLFYDCLEKKHWKEGGHKQVGCPALYSQACLNLSCLGLQQDLPEARRLAWRYYRSRARRLYYMKLSLYCILFRLL